MLLESIWGNAADRPERLRSHARDLLRRLRGEPDDHHAEYPAAWSTSLPYGSGTTPEDLAALVTDSSWNPPRLYRLRDVEWATLTTLLPLLRSHGFWPIPA